MTISHFLTYLCQKTRKIMQHTADVLVVGSGPTGLTLATVLKRHGVSVKIIEKRQRLTTTTKATNLMHGAQEKLAIYDMVQPMVDKGGKLSRMWMYGYDKNLIGLNYNREKSPFKTVLLLGQNNIEAPLGDYLNKSDISVNFETELVNLQQNEDFVEVTMRSKEGEFKETFKYVVGCDGARSITKTFTKLDFTPINTKVTVRQVDAVLKWKRLNTMKQMWLFYYDTGFCAVIPLLDGITKFITFDSSADVEQNRKPTLEEMQTKLREICKDDTATLENPIWFSQAELLTGLAPALVDNRVILAGDAGNPILPNGGQGLNTGIQDSINLGWKLADTILYNGSSKLLQSYNDERLTLRAALEKGQNASLRYVIKPPKLMKWMIRKFGAWLMKKGEDPMIQAFSQLGVKYSKSPLTVEKLKRGIVKAGDSIQDADLLLAKTNQEVSLFAALSFPQWKLVYFDNGKGIETSNSFNDIESKFPFVKTFLISSSLSTERQVGNLYYDIDEIAHKNYGITQPTIYLIRPDNYVGLRTDNMQDVLNYIQELFK
jgi:2-polyprenyl-6-methoxyphenol hydroxylase-like FAD-dependent oxidoreductase